LQDRFSELWIELYSPAVCQRSSRTDRVDPSQKDSGVRGILEANLAAKLETVRHCEVAQFS